MDIKNEKVTLTQIITRAVCAVACAIGVSACIFSLTLQIEEIGTMMSSIVWFSGLFAVVVSCGGYAASCNPRKGNSWIIPALIVIVGGAGIMLQWELMYLRSYEVAYVALGAFAVCALWCIVYRQILKREDPDAI